MIVQCFFLLFTSCINQVKFWGKSIEFQPKGLLTIEFPLTGEMFTWNNVNCVIHNIVGQYQNVNGINIYVNTEQCTCPLLTETLTYLSAYHYTPCMSLISNNCYLNTFIGVFEYNQGFLSFCRLRWKRGDDSEDFLKIMNTFE